MRWLQSAWTDRYNALNRHVVHLFQGRYKAMLVDEDEDIRLALALSLSQEERITLAQAARLCGLDRIAFQHHLAARKIPVHYGSRELADDLRTIESL